MSSFMLNKGKCKPFKSIEEQLDLLIQRGLIVSNRDNALDILSRTNYYRFSAYSLTLRKGDLFYEGVTFDNIYELYRFDDAFRKIIIKYSSYIEIAFRTYISYEHSKKYGPLGYMDSVNFANSNFFAHMLLDLTKEIKRSDDAFVEHHKRDLNSVFPIWVALECSSFGNISKMFKNMIPADKKLIASKYYKVHHSYVSNWLQVCVYARNIAAHGGRFYNRNLKSVPPKIHSNYRDVINTEKAFSIIYVMQKLLPTKALSEALRDDLSNLFNKYPFAKLAHMGFPDNWKEILADEETNYSFEYHVR